jgi:arginine decarboxylase-like protein
MKLYGNQISSATKVQILISQYLHLGKLEVIEDWVGMRQVHELEEELSKRGVIWDRNCDMMGSEHLYIESAIVNVDTLLCQCSG